MLTQQEIETLDREGYLFLGQLLTETEVAEANNRLAELMQAEGENAGAEFMASKYMRYPKEAGADRLADLVNKGSLFDKF